MIPLPLDNHISSILDMLASHRSLVLSAAPGSGKTTRLPPALVTSGLINKNESVVLLQPRRVAARAAAARIAFERNWSLGREVGYQVRHDRKLTRGTRLRVVTEGILSRQIAADPFLEGVGAVVLDEFHERSLHTDLALAMTRDVQTSANENLIVIVMSATLDADPIAKFLGDCPIVRVESRTHHVAIEYRESHATPIESQIAASLEHVLTHQDDLGDILVFLPGVREIERTSRRIGPIADRYGLWVLPLHGRLSAEAQDRALLPAPAGLRKVVLATNVAETSLTIDGVTTVIDSGKARVASLDQARGLDRLDLCSISRASAEQRAGRAGRTAPGRCIRLWSERSHRLLPQSDKPEIERVDLAAAVLSIHALGYADAASFPWFEAPPRQSIDAAERLLTRLGALEPSTRRPTHIGSKIAALPVHPRLGRLLLEAAAKGCIRQGAAIAAILSEPDFLNIRANDTNLSTSSHMPIRRGFSDVLTRLDALDRAQEEGFSPMLRGLGIDPHKARQTDKVRGTLESIARRLKHADIGIQEAGDDDLLKLVLLAYPDRVARRRAAKSDAGVMVGGRGVRLEPESVVRESEFFVVLDPRDDKRRGTLEARVSIASGIEPEWLEELFPDSLVRTEEARYDESRRRVVGVATVRYLDLVVREQGVAIDLELAGGVLAEAIKIRQGWPWVLADEASRNWLARLAWLRSTAPGTELPSIGPDRLDDLLAAACRRKTSEDQARAVALVPIFEEMLTYSQLRMLSQWAPVQMALPSGRKAKLLYSIDRPPVVSARLQELFGWAQTPTIAGGAVAIVVEILGPNQRPVQVTDDLASFWATTYFQVRKDLRARYPKHAWPDDPLVARPITKK